jgi:hypothetical protein
VTESCLCRAGWYPAVGQDGILPLGRMVSCRRLSNRPVRELSKINKPIFNRRQVTNLPYNKLMRRLFVCLAIVAPLSAATSWFQGSFENSNSGWNVVRGSAVTDSAVVYQSHKSMRVEAGTNGDACVRSAPIPLTIGKHYELSGWIRTDKLTVRDLDRSPIAIGAALSMASMPFDVHSECCFRPRR